MVLMMGICAPAAAEKILFIPLDNRPVSLVYTADSFRKAGVQVVTPPESLLASDRQSGDPEKLACWLDQEARGARVRWSRWIPIFTGDWCLPGPMNWTRRCWPGGREICWPSRAAIPGCPCTLLPP